MDHNALRYCCGDWHYKTALHRCRSTCKHENADHLIPAFHPMALCEQFRCIDCGAWLSLGPSNDTPEAVQIEIRAAELAAAWKPIGGVRKMITPEESAGWCGWPYRQPTTSGEFTGFLAAQIQEHEQDLGDVNWAGHHMADHPVSAK